LRRIRRGWKEKRELKVYRTCCHGVRPLESARVGEEGRCLRPCRSHSLLISSAWSFPL
jgi:hypothetical protein